LAPTSIDSAFDPTPAQQDEQFDTSWFADSKFRKYLDYAQFQWSTTVLGYDRKQRRKLFESVNHMILQIAPNRDDSLAGRFIHGLREQIFGRKSSYDRFDLILHYLILALEFVFMILLYHLVRMGVPRLKEWVKNMRDTGRWRLGLGSTSHGSDVAFYARMIRYLAKSGYRRSPGQTPREFATQVSQKRPDWRSLIPAVNAYYQVRYGARPLSNQQQELVDRLLLTLSSRPKTPPPNPRRIASPCGRRAADRPIPRIP